MRWSWRNISLGKRLMGACFLLAILPVILLAGLGWLLMQGFDLLGGTWQGELARLLPNGTAISVQFAMEGLRDEADDDDLDFKDVREQSQILEGSGIAVLVWERGQVRYLSPGADVATVQRMATERLGVGRSGLFWDDAGFSYAYASPKQPVQIYAAGLTPLKPLPLTHAQKAWRQGIRAAFLGLLGFAMLCLLLLGFYLARSLSRQVIEPLAAMRRSAEAVGRGDFEVPVGVASWQDDEVGATCRSFDAMREDLKAAREERERYEENRKELLAGISHDLATPLTSLKGYASGILDGIARTEEKKRHYVEQIARAANIMEHLVANLFLFSKLDLGRVAFAAQPVNLKAYLTDFVLERAPYYAEQGLALTLEASPVPEQAFPLVSLDPQEFQRVIENIIGNSQKYGGETPRVDMALHASDAAVQVRLADHGPGVRAAELPNLFQSFYRTDKARSQTAKGSGLGLAIARGITQGMGGQIWAEATPGGGLTIVIELPLAEGQKRAKTQGGEADATHPDRRG